VVDVETVRVSALDRVIDLKNANSASTKAGLDLKIFHTKEELQHILEEFEEREEEDEDEDEDSGAVSSQKQHFIIQKYVDNPLLLDGVEGCQPGSKVACSALLP
jgi:hypothetical protein